MWWGKQNLRNVFCMATFLSLILIPLSFRYVCEVVITTILTKTRGLINTHFLFIKSLLVTSVYRSVRVGCSKLRICWLLFSVFTCLMLVSNFYSTFITNSNRKWGKLHLNCEHWTLQLYRYFEAVLNWTWGYSAKWWWLVYEKAKLCSPHKFMKNSDHNLKPKIRFKSF